MAYGYNTSANQTRNNSYSYSPSQEPQTSVANGDKSFNYSEIYDSANPESSAQSTKNNNSKSSSVGVWGITMGQSHNFTLYIKDINESDGAFKLASRDGYFLPLKSLDFKPVKLENLKIKAGIFSDLPFFHRRNMGMLSCSMVDSDKSLISQKLYHWWNACVNTELGCVSYVDEMCRSSEYTEFTHDGKIAARYGFIVMPDGEISVNRNYEGEGNLTEYKFNLLIVSNIKVYNGNNGKWVEADWGSGGGPDANYERRVHGVVYNYNGKGTNAHINEPAIADYIGRD